MTSYFHNQLDFQSVGKFHGQSGIIPFDNLLPIHSFSSDMKYCIHTNGMLSVLFSIKDGFGRGKLTKVLDDMPGNAAVQVYSCKTPESSQTYAFVCISKMVEYRPEVKGFKSFFLSFTNSEAKSQLARFRDITNKTFEEIMDVTRQHRESGYFEIMNSAVPLLNKFSLVHLTSEGYKFKFQPQYNLSYLILSDDRFGLIVEISSMRTVSELLFELPETTCETVFYTCLHYPSDSESRSLIEKNRNYVSFQAKFAKNRPNTVSFLTNNVTDTQLVKSSGANVVMNHYVMFLSHSARHLTDEAENYVLKLNSNGASVNASIIKTEENYSYFFPGNYRVKVQKGVHMGSVVTRNVAPTLLQRLHY